MNTLSIRTGFLKELHDGVIPSNLMEKIRGNNVGYGSDMLEPFPVLAGLKAGGQALDTTGSAIKCLEKNIDSVLLVISSDHIIEHEDTVTLVSSPLNKRKVSDRLEHQIDPNIEFGHQPSAKSLGTAFFVKTAESAANKIFVGTAAHVVVGNSLDFYKIRFVSGFAFTDTNDFRNGIVLKKENVFMPVPGKHNHKYHLSRMYSDWALIEVTQAYPTCIKPAISMVDTFRFSGDIAVKDTVYSIGHGLGLPLKLVHNGHVSRTPKGFPYFECTLGLLGGNSGSPVFCANTHQLVGIYIRGTRKFVYDEKKGYMIIKNINNAKENQECQLMDELKYLLS